MARLIGDVDLGEVDRWCRAHLDSHVVDELFREGYLSAVLGLRLASGQPVVVKIRRPTQRLTACWTIHQHMYERGFPCPEPLIGPQPLGNHVATAEALVRGDAIFPDSGRAARPFAEWLARLVALAPKPDEWASLEPSPPWTAWNHREPLLWPWPDDRDIDLNTVGGPAWIDPAGRGARERLKRASGERVVGHGDWYTGNLRWNRQQLEVAYDWDRAIADREPVIVGLAAAVFPATRGGTEQQ